MARDATEPVAMRGATPAGMIPLSGGSSAAAAAAAGTTNSNNGMTMSSGGASGLSMASSSSQRLTVVNQRKTRRFLLPSRPSLYKPAEGKMSIKLKEEHGRRAVQRLTLHDPYHTLIGLPLPVMLVVFAVSHVVCWIAFAPLYMIMSRRCDLATRTFQRALYFSTITQTTIGYGAPDLAFNGCNAAFWAIATQTIVGLALNGILVGALYTKIARGRRRTVRVVFSETAIIRKIRGQWHFMFQTVDRTSAFSNNQIIEAHVRCYAIRHALRGDLGERVYFQQCAMRLSHPNDELGAMLMMALPSLVTHRVDAWSPLCPSPEDDYYLDVSRRRSRNHHDFAGGPILGGPPPPPDMNRVGTTPMMTMMTPGPASTTTPAGPRSPGRVPSPGVVEQNTKPAVVPQRGTTPPSLTPSSLYASYAPSAMNTCRFPDLVLREADCEAGGRSFCACSVCGEAYETPQQLARHRLASAVDERVAGHDRRTVCPETGEALPSTASAVAYCARHGYDAPSRRAARLDQLRHSRVNHLKYLPRQVIEDDDRHAFLSSRRPPPAPSSSGGSEKKRQAPPSSPSGFAASPWERTQQRRRARHRATNNSFSDADEAIDAAADDDLLEVQSLVYRPDDAGLDPDANAGSPRDADDAHDDDGLVGVELGAARTHTIAGRDAGDADDDDLSVASDEALLKAHMRRCDVEVLVVIEAIEPITSSTLMARHSYKFSEGEIQFNKTFVPCVSIDDDGAAILDLDAFHRTRDAPPDAEHMLSTPSII